MCLHTPAEHAEVSKSAATSGRFRSLQELSEDYETRRQDETRVEEYHAPSLPSKMSETRQFRSLDELRIDFWKQGISRQAVSASVPAHYSQQSEHATANMRQDAQSKKNMTMRTLDDLKADFEKRKRQESVTYDKVQMLACLAAMQQAKTSSSACPNSSRSGVVKFPIKCVPRARCVPQAACAMDGSKKASTIESTAVASTAPSSRASSERAASLAS